MPFPKETLLLFKQVYDLAKTEESTKAQMQAIAQAGHDASKHSVRRKKEARYTCSFKRAYGIGANRRKDDSREQVPFADKSWFK